MAMRMDDVLDKLATAITNSDDLEGLVRPLLEILEAITGLESTYLTRIDENQGVQHILFSRNTRQLEIPEGLSVEWSDTLCKRALDEQRAYTDDVAECWGDSEAAKALGIRTYLSEPVSNCCQFTGPAIACHAGQDYCPPDRAGKVAGATAA